MKCRGSWCDEKSYSNGYCQWHYRQIRRRGKIAEPYCYPGENWKAFDVRGKTTYEISDFGRIRSCLAGRKPKILKPIVRTYPTGTKRKSIVIGPANDPRNVFIHLEVARAFLPKATNGQHDVVFLDDDGVNCCLENLAWRREVIYDARIAATKNMAAAGNQEAKAVIGFISGNKNALDQILTRVQKDLHKHAYKVCRRFYAEQVDHEAVLQEALLKACSALKRGMWAPERPIVAWLKTICRNEVANFLQRRKKETGSFDGFKSRYFTLPNGDEGDKIDRYSYRRWQQEQNEF